MRAREIQFKTCATKNSFSNNEHFGLFFTYFAFKYGYGSVKCTTFSLFLALRFPHVYWQQPVFQNFHLSICNLVVIYSPVVGIGIICEIFRCCYHCIHGEHKAQGTRNHSYSSHEWNEKMKQRWYIQLELVVCEWNAQCLRTLSQFTCMHIYASVCFLL